MKLKHRERKKRLQKRFLLELMAWTDPYKSLCLQVQLTLTLGNLDGGIYGNYQILSNQGICASIS